MNWSQYLEVYFEESKEHLQLCNHKLRLLEGQPTNKKAIDEIFRAIHTLKGMSATMGFDEVVQLTHEVENVLDEIRHKRLPVTLALIDFIFHVIDDLEALLISLEKGHSGKKVSSAAIFSLQSFMGGREKTVEVHDETAPLLEEEIIAAMDYEDYEQLIIEEALIQKFDVWRLDICLRDDCQMKAARVLLIFRLLESLGEIIKSVPSAQELEKEHFESMFSVTIATKSNRYSLYKAIINISEVKEVRFYPIRADKWDQDEVMGASIIEAENPAGQKVIDEQPITKSIRVPTERLDELMEAFRELVVVRQRLEQLSLEIGHAELLDAVTDIANKTTDMQSILFNMQKVPAESVFNRFHSMVRRLSKELDKKVKLVIKGAATELDRSIVEEVGDSMLHFLRNAIDHGIETPGLRRQQGKPPEGTIMIRVYESHDFVMIEIEDDGAGIDEEVVARKAVELDFVTPSQVEMMSVQSKMDLIFITGFSTATQISNISGRGVGLDAAKSMIESLGGEVVVQSRQGTGTRFTIKVPL
mgnify:CR=1 FL=1